jgi:hypothetical protein
MFPNKRIYFPSSQPLRRTDHYLSTERKRLLMHISADHYEIRFDHEHPGCLHIVDTITQASIQMTAEEAVTILKLMLIHQEEIRLIRNGE